MRCMYEINFRTFVRCPVRFPISVQMYVSSFQLLHWRLNNSEIIKKRGSMTSLQSRHSESTCREWDMRPSWISRAFSKWSLSCAASPQRPYLGWLVGDQLVWSKQLRIEEISSTTYKVQEKVSASDLTVPDIPIIRCWGLMISQTGNSIHIPLSVSTMVSLSSKLSTFWTEILAPLHAMLCVASFSNFRFMFGGDGFLIYLHWVLSTRYATPRLCSAAPTTFEVIEQDKDGQTKFGTHNVKTVWDSSLHAPHHIGFVTWDFKMQNFEDPRDRRADNIAHVILEGRHQTWTNMRHPSSSHSFGIVFLHLDEIKLGSSCWDPELTESNSP